MTLGMEAAGVVEEVGAGSPTCSGDRVGLRRRDASLAPGATAAARDARERLVRLPEWIDDETAAAVFLKGLTAQNLLKGAYPLAPARRRSSTPRPAASASSSRQWAHHLGDRSSGR